MNITKRSVPCLVVTVPLVARQSCAYHMATERGVNSQTGSQPTQVLQAISNRKQAGSNKDSHRKYSSKKDMVKKHFTPVCDIYFAWPR